MWSNMSLHIPFLHLLDLNFLIEKKESWAFKEV